MDLCTHLLYYGLPPLPEQIKEGGRAKVGMALATLVEAARVCVRAIALVVAHSPACRDAGSGL
jgi:hypothetical protein